MSNQELLKVFICLDNSDNSDLQQRQWDVCVIAGIPLHL